MPLIRISYPDGALSRDQKARVASELTDFIMEAEVGVATPAGRAITVVQFDPTSTGDWSVGGRLLDEQPDGARYIIVQVIVAEGFLDKERRDLIHARTLEAFKLAMPESADALRGRVWCLITEIPHGSWGGAGQAINASDIARIVGLDETSRRSREIASRVRALDAKDGRNDQRIAAE